MKVILIIIFTLLILGFLPKSIAYAGMQPLTPENVKKVFTTSATKSEFCRLRIGDSDVKDFSAALLRGYGSAGQDPFIETLDKMACTDQKKNIIYGTLKITRNIPGDEVIYEQVFVIDDHYLRPTNLYTEMYTLTPTIPEQPDIDNSIRGVFKGISVKKGSLKSITDVENQNYADNNYYEGDREFGYIVHLDTNGTVDNIYVLYKGDIYKFIEKIKEVGNVLLVDYTTESSITPTPTPDPTADWKLYESDGFSFKYPKAWNFENYYSKYPTEKKYMKSYLTYEYRPKLNEYEDNVIVSVQTGSLQPGTIGYKGDLNTPISEFFNTNNNLWLTGDAGGGGPGTTHDLPIETSIGGKRAMLHSSHPSTAYEFANPGQITNVYIIPINGSLKDVVYISIFYSLANPKKEKLLADFNKILSTFKFTDAQNVDTSSWKTYTNSQGGYSVSYPPEILIPTSEACKLKETTDIGFYEKVQGNYVCSDTPFQFHVRVIQQPSNFKEESRCTRITKSKTSINGIPAERIISENIIAPDCYAGSIAPVFTATVNIMFPHNGSTFEVGYGLVNPKFYLSHVKKDLLDQILSTFKFTK